MHDSDRVNGGITLGHLMIGIAVIDVILVQLIVRPMRNGTDDRRRAAGIVTMASFALAVALCLIALFAPISRMQII